MPRRTLHVVGVIGASVMVSSADAAVRYCGIGNDEFAGDIPIATAAIGPCLTGPGDGMDTAFNQPGSGILAKLLAAQQMCQPGDVFIFHYAGHGDLQPAANEPDGDRGIISSLGGFTAGDVANDDQISNIINNFPTCCAVITIFDSCYSGDMIDHMMSDINRGLVITTADNACPAPGNSILLPFWNQAFAPAMTPGGLPTVGADANGDQNLTVSELFDKLSQITQGGFGSNPQAANFYPGGDPHLEYTVWQIPAPGTIVLLACACSVVVRRRR